MFDIKIGTMIPAIPAASMIRQLNPYGFECYTLDFNGVAGRILPRVTEHAKEVGEALDGRPVSCIGFYGDPINVPECRENLIGIIKAARHYGCSTIGTFAGGTSGASVPDNIAGFKAVFTEIAKIAEAEGVKIGFEGCGSGWRRNSGNIGYCPRAWEMMFDAVPSPALGLEWEPAHAVAQFMDPVAQARQWADRIVHIHGKDATVAWDIVRKYGIDGGVSCIWDRTPGYGDSNWADIFTALIMCGYEGACDIEGYHDPVHYDDMEWTTQIASLDYLKRARGGVSYVRGPEEYRGFQGSRKK